ncbi:MAG TPA: alpha/beta fold hydrolase [Mycobacterium sp.]|uniref:alpha/beta fold hydrolase n=1 Tax=Mycobacterium sp. TaxID=1785 RepID=UPI002B9B1B3B|nr:alpha/beta fold hydrolase [Mycobacterium sp.]HME75870.1 alpha/beta fold hydrolase [Mycobacterium sp.]
MIHGGLHTSWCWHRVAPLLTCPSIAVDLTGRGKRPACPASVRVSDFIGAAVDDLVNAGYEKTVVVAHSLGGITALGMCAAVPDRVAHVVFLSAVTPRPGSRPVDDLPVALRWFAKGSMKRQLSKPDGAFTLPKFVSRHMFCSDLSAADTDAVLHNLVPETPSISLDCIEGATCPASIGRTYVRLARDRALWPGMQRRMIANIAPVEVVTIDAGHEVMISRPEACAGVINSVVAGLS